MNSMTNAIACVLTGSALLVAGGCQDNPKMQSHPQASGSGAVTDVATPLPMTSGTDIAPAATATNASAIPVQPVSYDAGIGGPAAVTSTTVVTTTTPGGPGHYRVKHGDTLYSIAKAHYGDGKQWQRIAAANPGVSPTSLKVGQTISIPM